MHATVPTTKSAPPCQVMMTDTTDESWFPVDFDEPAPSASSASSAPSTLSHALRLHGSACSWARYCPRWRRVLLRLEGTRLFIDNELLQLTPAAVAVRVSAAPAADSSWCWQWTQPAPPGPGPIVRLKAQDQEWLLCAASDDRQDGWESALQDAIAMSHGPGMPCYEWSMGATLGTGSFGTVRAATHRRDMRRAACKLIAGSHGEAVRAAVRREIALMRRLRQELPADTAVLQLLEDFDHQV